MSTLQTIVLPRPCTKSDLVDAASRLVRLLRPFLPTVTSTRAAYRNQAAILHELGDAQSSRDLANAYHNAADVLTTLANR